MLRSAAAIDVGGVICCPGEKPPMEWPPGMKLAVPGVAPPNLPGPCIPAKEHMEPTQT